MRDHFMQAKETKTTGSATPVTSKRDEPLSTANKDVDMTENRIADARMNALLAEIPPEEIDSNSRSDLSGVESNVDSLDSEFSSVSQSKKRKGSQLSETNLILREFLSQRPKPSDLLPMKPVDHVQTFFDSMASTVRKFSPLEIAKIKLKISQIVFEQEIAWAESAARAEVIYVADDKGTNEAMDPVVT